MQLRIVCFEDDPKHREMLINAFEQHEAKFMFFPNPVPDWNVTAARAKEISEFAPDLAIVDLNDDTANDPQAGLRTIRQLRDTPETSRVPVIAWSVLLCDTPDGRRAVELAQGYGAIPLYKSGHLPPTADRFLEMVGITRR